MADNRYCSVRFKTGQALDEALAAALCSCDDAARAEAAAARAEDAAYRAEAISARAAVEVVNNLPAPSSALRGRLMLASNDNVDVLYICVRVNGIYTWAKFVPQIDPVSNNVYLVDLHGTNLKTADGMYLAVNE